MNIINDISIFSGNKDKYGASNKRCHEGLTLLGYYPEGMSFIFCDSLNSSESEMPHFFCVSTSYMKEILKEINA